MSLLYNVIFNSLSHHLLLTKVPTKNRLCQYRLTNLYFSFQKSSFSNVFCREKSFLIRLNGIKIKNGQQLSNNGKIPLRINQKRLLETTGAKNGNPVANAKAPKNEWEEMLKLSLMKRMNVMFRKYWYVAIPFHCVNSAIWFAAIFVLVKCGINAALVIEWIKPYVINSDLCPEFIKNLFEKEPDKLGNLAVALLLYKILSPGRYVCTVFGTIYLLRYLLRKGILVKSANEQLKSVKNSYLSHAVSRNIQRQKERFRRNIRKKH